jgi:hypothetical protein
MVKRSLHHALGASVALAAIAATCACKPDFPERQSIVSSNRILAVISEPPEAKPGDAVHYSTLFVGFDNAHPELGFHSIDGAAVDFAYCTRPKPLKELNDVSTDCFYPPEDAPDYIHELANQGTEVDGTLPTDGCRNFGSDVPEPKPGEPSGRPTDPDSTGGYYQPVRLELLDIKTLAETRIECDLPGATREVLVDFRARYHPNTNPILRPVYLPGLGAFLDDPQKCLPPNVCIHPGETVDLRASWQNPIGPVEACDLSPTCGDGYCNGTEDKVSCKDDCTTPQPCGGAEHYVSYDLATRTLDERRESMRVSWFATAGSFRDDRTGRDETETATDSDNEWTAPSSPGMVHLWVVLRDARGGAAWLPYDLLVQ